MTYLIMRRGPNPGAIYMLSQDEITIGRGTKNTIVIHDNEVSREHLVMQNTAKGYELRDLESRNGTYINGQKVDKAWMLQSHCVIELGDSITFEYRLGDPDHDMERETYRPPHPDVVQSRLKSYLVFLGAEPSVYSLDKPVVTLGRATSCSIIVVEPEVSREHFKMTLAEDGYWIEDLASTNGTMVNGQLIHEPTLLHNNDVLQIGDVLQIQFTNTPERFVPHIKTDRLVDKSDTASTKRTTTETQIPDFDQPAAGDPENASLENSVLITYLREDWEHVVEPLVDNLRSQGIPVWVEQELFEGSYEWMTIAEQARLECWLLVVIVSPAALRSELIKKNWRHFHNREKPVMLFIYEAAEKLPIGGQNLPKIQYNPAIPEVAFLQLANEIRRLRSQM